MNTRSFYYILGCLFLAAIVFLVIKISFKYPDTTTKATIFKSLKYQENLSKEMRAILKLEEDAKKEASLTSNLTCVVPTYPDPWHLPAKELFEYRNWTCPKKEAITFVDSEGRLRKMPGHNEVECFYSLIHRRPEDKINDYSQMMPITDDGIQLTVTKPYANTSCYSNEVQNKQVYRNTHYWIPDFNKSTASPDAPSVVILVIESLSRLGYLRFLKKTQKVMKDIGNFQVLSGFTKIGPTSFENSFGFLTGLKMGDGDCSQVDHWDNRHVYLWDNFKHAGYLTGYAEDLAQEGVFTYSDSGWVFPPTDWYPFPFWTNMYPKGLPKWPYAYVHTEDYCYEKVGPKIEMFSKQLQDFVDKMHKRRQTYFLYAFASQVTHELFDSFPFIDKHIANFMKSLKNKLENTVIILMGDHGPRKNSFHFQTDIGKLEASLPLFGIRVPESLNKKHSHLRHFLKLNQDRLTSVWDAREMMIDISMGTFAIDSRKTEAYSLSPWRKLVPNNRTCSEARIGRYCACDGSVGDVRHQNEVYQDAWPVIYETFKGWNCSLPSERKPELVDLFFVIPKHKLNIGLLQQVRLIIKLFPNQVEPTEVLIIRTRPKMGSKWSKWVVHFVDLSKAKMYCNSL